MDAERKKGNDINSSLLVNRQMSRIMKERKEGIKRSLGILTLIGKDRCKSLKDKKSITREVNAFLSKGYLLWDHCT